ncbi:type IV secretory pathway VirB10-like protein [Duganella sp. 1411]|uniref:PhaM family polyhydroxyalkanoate granule multifunctional regulatory protein n=1 Tax=Duganella sp. 1411 TaxID=2806572 RepID=UPI001B77430D|nr:PhaM family polyhydroxyalkanoate granule multifunctional regulatory protein [Duganella sp. 1411]MBP1206301.1 type IV secretory pathway VirB10-like protein [Duganella sp. 1411]
MTDTLDFVKNLWGSMSVPGLTAPTLSVDELDKKINDLKAVESWLNLNMSMLRGSIQALEVQRGTIATLKSVGASLAAAVNTGANDKSIFDANPYASAFFHHAREADKGPASTPSWPPAHSAPPAPPAPSQQAAPKAEEAPAAKPVPDAAAQMPNPAVWWNLLQDQFKQAVSTALASESMMADAAARATDTAVKFAAAAGAKPAAANAGAEGAQGAAAASGNPAAKPAPKKAPAKTAPAKADKPGKEKP